MELPKLYTLRVGAIVGYLGHFSPNIYCRECHRQARFFEELELFLDIWPECDLIEERTAGQLFVSGKLLARLEAIGAESYLHRPVSIHFSDDFRRQYPQPAAIPEFHYLMVTGQCDGPWLYHDRGEPCVVCGQPRQADPLQKASISYAQIIAAARGDTSHLQPVLVFPESWHGEDIFYVTETRIPIITERIAEILEETGNLRKEKARYVIPNTALEETDWQQPVCSGLGPAEWVR